MTRIYFQSDSIPKFAAKRLKYGLAIPQARAELWTARVLGYRDWYDMRNMLGRQAPSPLDEQISALALQDRRVFQAHALNTCFAQENFPYNGPSVVTQWQPLGFPARALLHQPADAVGRAAPSSLGNARGPG